MLSKHFKSWILKEHIDLGVLPQIQTHCPQKVSSTSFILIVPASGLVKKFKQARQPPVSYYNNIW